jgi:trigger factor
VAEAEGIECTDEDLDEEIEGVAVRVGEPADQVRERFERAGQVSAIRSDIKKRKALEWLIERAEVRDADGAAIDRSELELPADEDEPEDDNAGGAPEATAEPAEEEAQADA